MGNGYESAVKRREERYQLAKSVMSTLISQHSHWRLELVSKYNILKLLVKNHFYNNGEINCAMVKRKTPLGDHRKGEKKVPQLYPQEIVLM